MKKRIDILLGLALILVVACDPLGEPINESLAGGFEPVLTDNDGQDLFAVQTSREGFVKFSDRNFYQACVDAADTDGDSLVSLEEAAAVKELELRHRGVRDLAGLESFVNLEVFDAEGNGIVNADVFRELRYLRWFDLKGNPDLESFDLTGCTIYFDRCLFDTSEKLRYRTLVRQLNVTPECDPYSSCAEHLWDDRTSTDWSHHKNLIRVQEHARGEGGKAVVLSGLGWLDVDFVDGSFRRAMDDMLEYLYDIHPSLASHKAELDIYYLEYVSETRDCFVYPVEDFYEAYVEPYRDAYKEWRNEHYLDMKKAVLPDDDGVVMAVSMDLHPNVKIVPLRTSICTGASWCRDKEFQNMYVSQFNLSPSLDIEKMQYFGYKDDSFGTKVLTGTDGYDNEIRTFFGW